MPFTVLVSCVHMVPGECVCNGRNAIAADANGSRGELDSDVAPIGMRGGLRAKPSGTEILPILTE
jgi:hypothetical protein